MAALNRVIAATAANIVVSSTWRIGASRIQLAELLQRWGVNGLVIGKTPRLIEDRGLIAVQQPRGSEIQAWLEGPEGDRAAVEKFVILDDDSDMGGLAPRLVLTSMQHGLTEDLADAAIELMGR